MNTCSPRPAGRSLLLCLAALLAGLPLHAALDTNSDGMPDVWVLKHQAAGMVATADADGDGQTNAEEASAGTDPRSPGSIIQVTAMSLDGAGLHLTFPTVLGKRYQVRSAIALTGATWTPRGTTLAGVDGPATATLPPAAATDPFYHVLVLDADNDGDGVTDWEEITLGFDPNTSHSNGLSGQGDLAAITQGLQAPNMVALSATDPTAAEPVIEPAVDAGMFSVTRRGGFGPITVRYGVSGSAVAGSDYNALSGTVTMAMGINSATIPVVPRGDTQLESNESVTAAVTADPAYTVEGAASATVLIADKVEATGTGLNAQYYNFTPAPVTGDPPMVTPATFSHARIDPTVNFTWAANVSPTGGPAPLPTATATTVGHDNFISQWRGEVLPQFAQIYTFYIDVNRGGRLSVNGEQIINKWPSTGSAKHSATIALEAGVRYPILFEHYETTNEAKAILSWSSANVTPEQVIPTNRLFPNVPPQIGGDLDLLLLKNSPFVSYTINASGKPTAFAAANLPPGWAIDATTGVITGNTSTGGVWDVALTATNAFGSGSAILKVEVIATGGGITRDVWTGIAGASIGDIPLATPPTSTSIVNGFEAPAADSESDNYGARLHGFMTPPTSGIYKFWITGDEAAELWISDDDEPINSFKRAATSAPTARKAWTAPGAGKSPLMILEAGRKYYVEVRHKEATGADHVAVGWLKPGEGGVDPANAPAPTEVVPAYALSPYAPPQNDDDGGTLYIAVMIPQGSVPTGASGTATIRLSADERTAYVSATWSNLTSAFMEMHVHDGTRSVAAGNIVFDPAEVDVVRRPDGSFIWHITDTTISTAAQKVAQLKAGDLYYNVHSLDNPGGEIKGFFRLQSTTQTFTPPAPPPALADDHTNRNAASRFLLQSTFGPRPEDLDPANANSVLALGYSAWIDAQIAVTPTLHYPYVFATRMQTDPNGNTYVGEILFNSWWRHSIIAPDQLRQRVAFALSEILVVSEAGPLDQRADAISSYYDMLLTGAFGNFRDLMEAVTLHPAMGRYLDMLRNDKPDKNTGRIPNENYAREILQLFSIGLNRVWPDGTLMINSKGDLIPTYDQNTIIGFSHVFTGWDYNYTGGLRTSFGASSNWLLPMREIPLRHFTGQKRLLNNVVLPGLPMVAGTPLDPYSAHQPNQHNDAAYTALPGVDIDAAHDAIFQHPNLGVFICRQLIQRLVTSTPSRGYLYRVVQKFNDNGSGVRGDMTAVVKAILLDYEARSPQMLTQQGFGKQREPVLKVTGVARAFPAPPPVQGTYSQVGTLMTVTTSTPHLYNNNETAFLDFSGGSAGDPDDAPYTVSNRTANTFEARALTSESATYIQGTGLISITVDSTGNGHTYNPGNEVFVRFTSSSPVGTAFPADGLYIVANESGTDAIIDVYPKSAARTVGTYSQAGGVVTFSSATAHGHAVGASVFLDFTSSTPAGAVDALFTVATVSTDGLQFAASTGDAVTRTGNAAAVTLTDVVARTGAAYTTKPAYGVDRTGTVAVNYSDWSMNGTETDLNQTPLRSPTVFNYFLPDFQYPGPLARAGLITPEFELTSDTSVIRQANFMYNALVSTDALGQKGLSSFKSGGRDIFLDLRPLMAVGPGAKPWVHNDNLPALIAELNTRVTGGQLSANACTIISNHVKTITYSTPVTPDQLRDRARGVVHLIVTSPDFAIQR